ncbi:MAG: hypothetical protein IMY75_03535, partial [Chloroflexi bacterium]|nr:hypothetical protein [Chloroflexota bacterium]
ATVGADVRVGSMVTVGDVTGETQPATSKPTNPTSAHLVILTVLPPSLAPPTVACPAIPACPTPGP